MNTKSKWNLDAPMVIAHRGASLHAPENTMAAFLLAVQYGAEGIELDVQMTADGHVVVCHDRTLDRTTTGNGPVSAHTLKEILRLDAGSYFAPDFAGERVPTLREVFQNIADHMLINIELKTIIRSWNALSEKVVSLVRELKTVRRVLVSSFSPMALRHVRSLAPEIPVGLILAPTEPKWLRILFSRMVSYDTLHPNRNLVDQEMIQRQQKDGKRVVVWTLNEPAQIEKFVGFGVDGLVTDAPDVARRVIG
jgi:glycerophosphoryl diester phosphodiesterase